MNTYLAPLMDAHLHLQDPRFDPDLAAVLDRARSTGVQRMICNGTQENDWPRVVQLARQQAGIIPFFGIHPWHVDSCSPQWEESLAGILARSPCGVGEIGLDRWISGRDEAKQEAVFRRQLRLAKQWDRPFSVHCLRAWGELMRVLAEELADPHPFLIHAYGGSAELIKPLALKGAYFSCAGNILDARKIRQQAVLRLIPADRLLIETDAPDLPPPPEYRQVQAQDADGSYRNEPANLCRILHGIAHILGQSKEGLARQIWENGTRFIERLKL